MRLTPLTALLLLACSTSAPTTSPGGSTSLGSSAEALRKQRQLDADDVQRCRDVEARCNANDGSDEDAGSGRGCEFIGALCDQLEEQLAADRAELEQCLEEAAACEAAATDPVAECADERAACEPADRDHRGRRGRTLECSNRAELCLSPGFGRGRGRGIGDEGDAGAPVCREGDDDFVGCCQGKHGRPGERGDAGINGGDRGPGFGFGPGFGGIDRERDDRGDRDGDADDPDAGRPRRRF